MNLGAGPRSPGDGLSIATLSVPFKWPVNPAADAYVLYVGIDPVLKTGSFPYEQTTPGTQRIDVGQSTAHVLQFSETGRHYWQVEAFIRSLGLLDSSPVWSFDVEQASALPPGGSPPGTTPPPPSSSPWPSPDTLMYVSGAVAVLGILWVLNSSRRNTR